MFRAGRGIDADMAEWGRAEHTITRARRGGCS